jgi:hypothetical protein
VCRAWCSESGLKPAKRAGKGNGKRRFPLGMTTKNKQRQRTGNGKRRFPSGMTTKNKQRQRTGNGKRRFPCMFGFGA